MDITNYAQKKFEAILCEARAAVFGGGESFKDLEEAWTRFWGMRHGVKYAEPFHAARGSMSTIDPVRKLKVLNKLP